MRAEEPHLVIALGTCPANAGSTGIMPKERIRSRIRCWEEWEGELVSMARDGRPSLPQGTQSPQGLIRSLETGQIPPSLACDCPGPILTFPFPFILPAGKAA